MATAWVEKLKSAQKTCLVQDGRRKIHFTFPDGTDLAEEYDLRTNDLIIRKWRSKKPIGGISKWDFEVGEELLPRNLEMEGMTESSTNPIFVRKDTRDLFQWRIRNLPYPLDTYKVTVDDDKRNIIIRTTNKKYYKKFSIPDMERLCLHLQQGNISTAHANNTLIVSYKKPKEVLEMETELQSEFKKLKASKDGDVDCTPS